MSQAYGVLYKLSGENKGNLDNEEMFNTKQQMDKRYDELFKKGFVWLKSYGMETD